MRTAIVLLGLALCARAEEIPVAPGVTVEVRAESTEFALGDPILVEVVYRNEGKETWEVHEPHVLRFYEDFEVRDAEGATAPNPFGHIDYEQYNGRVSIHKLPPGGAVTVRKYVNQNAGFERTGEYAVTARGEIYGQRDGKAVSCRYESKLLKIKILPAPDKKARDAIVADLKALWRDPKLREREEYARYRPYVTESNGSTDALRLLAFRREQELLPFWIERCGDDRSRAFAAEALAGLPDRAAVLKALEERLARGERERFLWLYACLAVPKTDDVEWKDVFARRWEIEEKYRGR